MALSTWDAFCTFTAQAEPVDAAILFADIMIPLIGIGIDLDIVEHIGPVIKNPIRTIQDVKKFRDLHPQEDIPYVLQTIAMLRKELEKKV